MVLVANAKRDVVRGALAYIENEIHAANRELTKEADSSGEYDPTFQATLDGSAKTHVANCVQMLRWLKETYFNIAGAPAAYTDGEVDAIDPNIRQHDDGT